MENLWPGWDIVECIGSGGFGKVYKIRKVDDSTGDYFSALKVIRIPNSPEDYQSYIEEGYDDNTITGIFTSQVKRIVEEFRLMAKFKGNSNIVSYEDHMIVPHEDGKGWDILIRMELLTSLTKFNANNTMTVNDAIEMGIGICRALELCQKANVIHRDIKPQNIFISDFGEYKLGDFGIAKTMDHTTRATKTGTYTYMAPEVYRGESYGTNIDLYSLGLVMYWALNEKRMPFLPLPPEVPTAADLEKSQAKRLAGETLPPPKNGNDQLKAVVLKACAYNSADRYQSPKEMRSDLEKVLNGVPLNIAESKEPDATAYTVKVDKPAANPAPQNQQKDVEPPLYPSGAPRPAQKVAPQPAANPVPQQPKPAPQAEPQRNIRQTQAEPSKPLQQNIYQSRPKKGGGGWLFFGIFFLILAIAAIIFTIYDTQYNDTYYYSGSGSNKNYTTYNSPYDNYYY